MSERGRSATNFRSIVQLNSINPCVFARALQGARVEHARFVGLAKEANLVNALVRSRSCARG